MRAGRHVCISRVCDAAGRIVAPFTGNAITTAVPVIRAPNWPLVGCVALLWAIAMVANVIDAFAVPSLYAFTPVFREC